MSTINTRLLELLWIRALRPYGALPSISPERVLELRALVLSWAKAESDE